MCGFAAVLRGARDEMRQLEPASDREKKTKRDNLTQERPVNAFLLKKVILLKKLITSITDMLTDVTVLRKYLSILYYILIVSLN